MTVTFEKAAAAIAHLNIQSASAYYIAMIEDLKNLELLDVLKKWREAFAKDENFVRTLSKQLRHENKNCGLATIYTVSKFAP